MYEFTFQLEEIYILITGSSVSVPQLVCCCGNEVGCCCALSSRDDLSADNTSPLWASYTFKCSRHQNPLISAEICLKYQQGVSCHPTIICQIWSLKNIKHILNTVQRTCSVSDCHSADKLSVLGGIPFLISILIMGILSLMVWLCFMAFQKDGEAVCGITQTYVIRSGCCSRADKSRQSQMWLWWMFYWQFGRCKLWHPGPLCGKSEGVVRVEGKHNWDGTLKIDLFELVKSFQGHHLWFSSVNKTWAAGLRIWGFRSETITEPKRKNSNIIHSALQISILMSSVKALDENFDNFAATSFQWNHLLT